MKYILLICGFVFLALLAYTQSAPGIELNAGVNNTTVDTCNVDFFDDGGHQLNC